MYILKEPRTKLDCNWVGPYKISRKINDLTVEIMLDSNKFKIVHTNKLKLACIRPGTSTEDT